MTIEWKNISTNNFVISGNAQTYVWVISESHWLNHFSLSVIDHIESVTDVVDSSEHSSQKLLMKWKISDFSSCMNL